MEFLIRFGRSSFFAGGVFFRSSFGAGADFGADVFALGVSTSPRSTYFSTFLFPFFTGATSATMMGSRIGAGGDGAVGAFFGFLEGCDFTAAERMGFSMSTFDSRSSRLMRSVDGLDRTVCLDCTPPNAATSSLVTAIIEATKVAENFMVLIEIPQPRI